MRSSIIALDTLYYHFYPTPASIYKTKLFFKITDHFRLMFLSSASCTVSPGVHQANVAREISDKVKEW